MKNLYIDGYDEYLKQKKEWEIRVKEELEKKEEEIDYIEKEEDDCVFIKPKTLLLNEKTQKKEVKVEWKDNKKDTEWEKLNIEYPIVGKGAFIYHKLKEDQNKWVLVSKEEPGYNSKLVYKKINL